MDVNTVDKHSKHFSLDEIAHIATFVVNEGKGYTIWLFKGEMGAGKTTLIKEICRVLGVEEQVSSPTFSIVNEYITDKGETAYHFDCYRLKNESEALDIGIEEYFDSGGLCMIEWPEKIHTILPDKFLLIRLEECSGQERTLYIEKYDG